MTNVLIVIDMVLTNIIVFFHLIFKYQIFRVLFWGSYVVYIISILKSTFSN